MSAAKPRTLWANGNRVRHTVTQEVGTVVEDETPPLNVRVQFDVDYDEDGRGWPWMTEPEKLEAAW